MFKIMLFVEQAFRVAYKKQPVRNQNVVKFVHQHLLRVVVHVDHHVPAEHQVKKFFKFKFGHRVEEPVRYALSQFVVHPEKTVGLLVEIFQPVTFRQPLAFAFGV